VGAARNDQNSKSMMVKKPEEILLMQEANQIVAETLAMLEKVVEPDITTWDLDKLAEDLCIRRNAIPAFKGYRGFPASLCVSINEEVVHGIPSKKRRLKKGDILSVDFGVKYKGYFGDSAITIPVGKVDSAKSRLIDVTKESLQRAIAQVQVGKRIADISNAVQTYVEKNGYSVVRQFVGHGIGTSLHEGPEIPNFVQDEPSPRILEGLVLAIEPMVNMGTYKVRILRDGWTVVTTDKKPSAHFEHSVAATSDGPLILSSRRGL
jgi:methionyl aminopeptidase